MEASPTNNQLRGKFLSWHLAKYMNQEVFFGFVVGTAVFLMIMLMFQAIRLSEFVINYKVSFVNVATISYYLLLSFVTLAVPIAFLFSVLMGISRANSEGEMMAMQVSGISLGQAYRPIGIFSIGLTIFCLYTSLFWGPRGNRGFELLFTKISSEKIMQQLKPGVFMQGFHGLVLFVKKITPVQREMRDVFVYDERDEDHPLAITAKAGILKSDPDRGEITLRLSDGAMYIDKKKAGGIQQKITFDVYDVTLKIDKGGKGWRDYSLPSLDYYQIQERLTQTNRDPRRHRELLVELHRRISLSFACIVFGAMGFFIGTLSVKGLRSSSIVICLIVGTVYWLFYIAANALASQGWVMPWLGIWIPNVLFSFVPVYCYRRQYR